MFFKPSYTVRCSTIPEDLPGLYHLVTVLCFFHFLLSQPSKIWCETSKLKNSETGVLGTWKLIGTEECCGVTRFQFRRWLPGHSHRRPSPAQQEPVRIGGPVWLSNEPVRVVKNLSTSYSILSSSPSSFLTSNLQWELFSTLFLCISQGLYPACLPSSHFVSSNISAICRPSCVNGGTCSKPGTCSCVKGYRGDQCQTRRFDYGTILLPIDNPSSLSSFKELSALIHAFRFFSPSLLWPRFILKQDCLLSLLLFLSLHLYHSLLLPKAFELEIKIYVSLSFFAKFLPDCVLHSYLLCSSAVVSTFGLV